MQGSGISERKKEIGIRRALGEARVHIIAQFVIESMLGMSLLAGLFFGLYPAWRAACVDPVRVLKYE